MAQTPDWYHLCPVAPTQRIACLSAVGVLPAVDWSDRLSAIGRALDGDRHADGTAASFATISVTDKPLPKANIGELVATLRACMPPGGHRARVRAALEEGHTQVPDLTALLRGAIAADEIILQRELLERLGRGISPSVPLLAVVQAPLLKRLRRVFATDGISVTATEAVKASAAAAAGATVEVVLDGRSIAAFLRAAELARKGDQHGAKHGCVLHGPSGELLGEGYNHNCYTRGSKIVLHAECHALAATVKALGESAAFAAFATATAFIVELDGDDVAYGYAPPCPKCNALLRAVGVQHVVHSSAVGPVRLSLTPNESLLAVEIAYGPFRIACEHVGAYCSRLP